MSFQYQNRYFKPNIQPTIFSISSPHELSNTYAKIEYFDSTGSHKDRESRKIVEYCRKNNINAVGCASTGNFGISSSAHCKMAGIKRHVLISTSINTVKQHLLELQDAIIHKVNAIGKEIYEVSNTKISEMGIYNANPGQCFLKVAANKSIGYEINVLFGNDLDYIICPANNGTLLRGVWFGLREKGAKAKMVGAVAKNSSIASSISGNLEFDDPASVYKQSQGFEINLTDQQISDVHNTLLSMGIFCEPSSAASLAAAKILNSENQSLTTRIICIITGCGLKK
jgi:threonine synthase